MEHILTYGTFAALGIVAAFVCALLLCFRLRQNWVRQIPMMILSLLGLVVGAKLFGMISYEAYLRQMGITDITFRRLFDGSGIVFYGGLLGYFGMLALLFWKLLPKKRLGWDIIAVSTPLFHAIARIGCYFGHEMVDGELVWQPCCYGIRMDNAFCAHFWDSRLPTQLIESTFNFVLFGILLWLILSNQKEERRGNLIGLYLIAYPLFRFVIEFFRGDEVRGGYGIFSFSQVVSLVILFGVALFLLLRYKGFLKPVPPDPYDPEVDKYDLFAKPEPDGEADE
ncbi:MAG: prolipoprotein diacylglyceryl transferase [Oscillospiraceae bacterium]|nr:prolipoprotein diacylglyceryl transferase [Oscillospiraceae bacterium]